MSNQSQNNLPELHRLFNFLHCLVPCYTQNNTYRYYALVYYCNDRYGINDTSGNGGFMRYSHQNNPNHTIFLHQDTVNQIRGECTNCIQCSDIKHMFESLSERLGIEIIRDADINANDSYNNNRVAIYTLVPAPMSIMSIECNDNNEDRSIFIKNNAYIEDINNTNQEVNLRQLLQFKRQLLIRAINAVVNTLEQSPVNIDRRLLLRAINIILEQTSISINNDKIEAIVNELVNRRG